ncbi:Transthyretin-like family protein [Aphelenchoides fujianensis]|nr:Transthyretin-like family protein [Aphelenchoides fujianensis]
MNVQIYNTCKKDRLLPCPKKFSVHIPNDYIAEGELPTKVFDIGTLNLNGEFSGEHYDCIN